MRALSVAARSDPRGRGALSREEVLGRRVVYRNQAPFVYERACVEEFARLHESHLGVSGRELFF